MWRLEKEFHFEASHLLPHHDGNCRRLHGHSWKGRLVLQGDKLVKTGAKRGMLIDYGDVSRVFEPLVRDYLDHRHLNDTTQLENPTSEELARWIYDRLKPELTALVAVRIEETCSSACEYWPKETS